MGGELVPLGKELAEQAEPIAKDAVSTIKRGATEAWDWFSSWSHRSLEGELSKTESGKAIIPTVKNYIYESKSDAQKFMQTTPNMDIDTAAKLGKKYNKISHFGINNSVVTQVIENAKQERSTANSRSIADGFAQLLDERPKPISTLSRLNAGLEKESGVENKVRQAAAIRYLYKVSLPHLFQPLNNTITAGWKSTMEAIPDTVRNYKDLYKMVQDSNVLFDETLHDYKNAKSGVGSWIEKNLHINSDYVIMPFFRAERRAFLTFSANVGRVDAMRQAQELLEGGTKSEIARLKLRDYGIDPKDVEAQEGKLTDDQIHRAMYEQANRAMFIKSPLRTPQKWERNSITRTLFMYKPYATQQVKLLKDSLINAYKREGALGAAKVAGTIGTIFPMAGEMIWSVDEALKGKSPTNRDDKIHAFTKVFGENIATEGADEYLSALAHVAALGMYYQIVRAATYHHLGNYLLGPFPSWLAEEVENVWAFTTNPTTKNFSNAFLPQEARSLVKSLTD